MTRKPLLHATEHGADPLLELNDVHVAYGVFKVLRGVTLQVAAGEAVALIGANGAGKSTVLKSVAGFVKASSGRISLGQAKISGMRPDQILSRGCAYVAQGQDLFPLMKVSENVRMGGYLIKSRTERNSRLRECLELFPVLATKADELAGGLSGGERQQLKLARAFMTRPNVLLLDEPSAGMSPVLVDGLFEDLERVVKEAGIGVLLVEQNVSKAFEFADRVCLLDLGQVTVDNVEKANYESLIREVFLGETDAVGS